MIVSPTTDRPMINSWWARIFSCFIHRLLLGVRAKGDNLYDRVSLCKHFADVSGLVTDPSTLSQGKFQDTCLLHSEDRAAFLIQSPHLKRGETICSFYS